MKSSSSHWSSVKETARMCRHYRRPPPLIWVRCMPVTCRVISHTFKDKRWIRRESTKRQEVTGLCNLIKQMPCTNKLQVSNTVLALGLNVKWLKQFLCILFAKRQHPRAPAIQVCVCVNAHIRFKPWQQCNKRGKPETSIYLMVCIYPRFVNICFHCALWIHWEMPTL